MYISVASTRQHSMLYNLFGSRVIWGDMLQSKQIYDWMLLFLNTSVLTIFKAELKILIGRTRSTISEQICGKLLVFCTCLQTIRSTNRRLYKIFLCLCCLESGQLYNIARRQRPSSAVRCCAKAGTHIKFMQ